jgi:hypothetical protein
MVANFFPGRTASMPNKPPSPLTYVDVSACTGLADDVEARRILDRRIAGRLRAAAASTSSP